MISTTASFPWSPPCSPSWSKSGCDPAETGRQAGARGDESDVRTTFHPQHSYRGGAHRIQQSLQVILAGLDERVALSGLDMEALRRDLRMLLELERIQIATAEIDRAEKVIEYMLRRI
jgi:hypothetical protein